jgi:hypothetical protein
LQITRNLHRVHVLVPVARRANDKTIAYSASYFAVDVDGAFDFRWHSIPHAAPFTQAVTGHGIKARRQREHKDQPQPNESLYIAVAGSWAASMSQRTV